MSGFKKIIVSIFSLLCMQGAFSLELRPIEIKFHLVAGGQEVRCGGAAVPLGSTAIPSRLKDARFYIHNVALTTVDGMRTLVQLDANEWQFAGVSLLDFEDASAGCDGDKGINRVIVGKIPAGRYNGLSFSLGVPVEAIVGNKVVQLNHSNVTAMPPPLDLLAMDWSWQGGRKFVKLEVRPQGGVKRVDDTIKVWSFHLGSTACSGNPANGQIVSCENPNRVRIDLPGYDPLHSEVAIDIAMLLEQVDLSKDDGGAAGCMGAKDDPECLRIFPALGLGSGMLKTPTGNRWFKVIK